MMPISYKVFEDMPDIIKKNLALVWLGSKDLWLPKGDFWSLTNNDNTACFVKLPSGYLYHESKSITNKHTACMLDFKWPSF